MPLLLLDNFLRLKHRLHTQYRPRMGSPILRTNSLSLNYCDGGLWRHEGFCLPHAACRVGASTSQHGPLKCSYPHRPTLSPSPKLRWNSQPRGQGCEDGPESTIFEECIDGVAVDGRLRIWLAYLTPTAKYMFGATENKKSRRWSKNRK